MPHAEDDEHLAVLRWLNRYALSTRFPRWEPQPSPAPECSPGAGNYDTEP